MSYNCNFFGVVKKNYFWFFKVFFVVYARMPVPFMGRAVLPFVMVL